MKDMREDTAKDWRGLTEEQVLTNKHMCHIFYATPRKHFIIN